MEAEEVVSDEEYLELDEDGDTKAADLSDDGSLKQKEASSDSGCSHYKRHCAFLTPCCKKIYVCRLCHNDNEMHELDRHSVQEIQCLKCNTMQKVGRECVNCAQLFGKYFCEVCRMYDDTDKKQFHCEACGICRIGGRENFFHCVKCDMCLSKTLENSHKCVEKAAHSGCPVCLEDLHSSTANLNVLRCGHIVHKKCYMDMLSNGMYTCPLCGVSTIGMNDAWQQLDEEIEQTLMPEDYRNVKVWILCKDCQLTSETTYHVLGLKCHGCGSYNTCNTASRPAAVLDPAAASALNPAAAGADADGANQMSAAGADAAAIANPADEAAAGAANFAATADVGTAATDTAAVTVAANSTDGDAVNFADAAVGATASAAASDHPNAVSLTNVDAPVTSIPTPAAANNH